MLKLREISRQRNLLEEIESLTSSDDELWMVRQRNWHKSCAVFDYLTTINHRMNQKTKILGLGEGVSAGVWKG